MTGAGFGLFVLAVVVSVGLGLLLYELVRAEGADREVASWEDAERLARRDTADEEG